jgi:hypothetical protein
VIHTFGRDLKFNQHIHALVTEGALDNKNEWVSSDFIPYEYLRKSLQKVLLNQLNNGSLVAEYRINEYDGKTVRFWYEDHTTKKRVDEALPVYKFLFNLIQHISPKHFRMVGRFGLYSRRSYQRAKNILNPYSFMRTKQLSWVLERKSTAND